jgi:Glycosyl transferase family 8
MNLTVFTIVSRNYFAYARTLGDSLRQSNPSVEFNVLIVDRKDPAFEAQHLDWSITWVEDLGISDFERVAFKYDILELNTNVKPTFAKHLLKQYQKVIYLDPDIYVYSSLQQIFDLLDRHAVVLTPHITEPINDEKLPGEPEFLTSGIYNLGFAAFNTSEESLKLLSWWEQRCLHLAYNEQSQGFFVDQKWMDFVPSLCSSAFILRDPQYNTAYWNLQEREVVWVNNCATIAGKPLVFFHFSGLPPEGDDRVSKYQTRYSLGERQDIAPLFKDYRECLTKNGHLEYLKLPYKFGAFSDGTPISSVARRVAAGSPELSSSHRPFESGSPIYHVLQRSHLLNNRPTAKSSPTSGTFKQSSIEEVRLQRFTAIVFRITLRVFGPSRYERLMRYITRSANLRGQSFLLRRDH